MTSAAENPAVYEAANVYLNEKLQAFRHKCQSTSGIETCSYCNQSKMLDYYHVCAEYVEQSQSLFDKLQINGQVFKILTPGRIVFVKSVRRSGASSTG